jgi:hypothetical protein
MNILSSTANECIFSRHSKGDIRMEETQSGTPIEETRKEYVAPTLTDFGSFAEITQGAFANSGVDNGSYS